MNIPVTVLMPVKNAVEFLDSATRGISSNVAENDEILVVNDNSSDLTLRELMSWASKDSRVRVLDNKKNGIVNALNLGLREATNPWICRFDVDDHYEPNRLQLQRAAITENVCAIFSDYDFWSRKHPKLGKISSAVNTSATALSLITGQRTAHPSALFNRDKAIDVGGYREEDFPAEDLSLWLRMSRVGSMLSIPETLLHYRLSSNSVTLTRRQESNDQKEKLIEKIGIHPTDIKNAFSEAPQIINSYRLYEDYEQRTILFLRDLVHVSRRQKINIFRQLDLKRILGHSGLHFAQTLWQLKSEQNLRNHVRNSLME